MRCVLVDFITELTAQAAGAALFTGSHGGLSAAQYALKVPTALVVFNDAGIGKAQAGIAALEMMQAAKRAAATVAHTSACIGQAQDTFDHSVFSHANGFAGALGIEAGLRCRDWFTAHQRD